MVDGLPLLELPGMMLLLLVAALIPAPPALTPERGVALPANTTRPSVSARAIATDVDRASYFSFFDARKK